MFWNIEGYIFFLVYKTLRTLVPSFFSIFFQSSFSGRKCISSQLYLFITGPIFVILSECVSMSSWFNTTVTAYWKHLLSFLLIQYIVAFLFFIQSRESKYDPPHILQSFKKLFYNFIWLIIHHDFYRNTFWIHYTFFFAFIFTRNKITLYW